MSLQITAFPDFPAIRQTCGIWQISFMQQLRKYSTSGAGHAPLKIPAFQPIERLAYLRAHLLRYRLQVVAAESEIK